MAWVCTECERTYEQVPERCGVCGSEDLVPATADESDRSRVGPRTLLENLRRLLSDPGRLDRSLVRPDSRVDLAFRLLLAVSVAVVLVVVVGSLL